MKCSVLIRYLTCTLLVVFCFCSCSKLQEDTGTQSTLQEQSAIKTYVERHYPGVTPSASGLYYISQTEGTGDIPGDNDFVIINYKGWTLDEKLFDTTDSVEAKANNITPLFALGGALKLSMKVNLPGWVEALKKMREGGKAIAIMPAALATFYNFVPRIYEFDLVKVIHNISGYEKQQLEDYIAQRGFTLADSTSGGIYYFSAMEGSGETPSASSNVYVKYKGMLLDGRVFDDGTYQLTMGQNMQNQILPGIAEAIAKTRKGGRATVVIPYYRAYGEEVRLNGYGQIVIPWYSTLRFDIQLINVW